MADAHKNFAYSTVATAPSPASSGLSLVVAAADGAKFPAPPFNVTIWPAGAQPTTANAEIARCTAKATDTFTITRAQEGSSARTVVVGDQIEAGITVKTLTDVENVQRSARSSNTILGAADRGQVICATAAYTQTLTAAATLGAGWWCVLKNDTNDGTTVLVVDPNGSETIDALTTITMYSGETRLVECDGSNFFSQLLEGGYAKFTPGSSSFIVPAGIEEIDVVCIGSGGQGGGGASSVSTAKSGGGGGGGGAVSRAILRGSDFTAGATVTVTVGAGGSAAGGGGAAGAGAAGTPGSDGAQTTFGSVLKAGGGGGGQGGTNAAIQGGGGGSVVNSAVGTTAGSPASAGPIAGQGGTPQGAGGNGSSSEWGGAAGSGKTANNAGNSGGGSIFGGPSGGGGGGLTAANAGGVGGAGGTTQSYTTGGGASGGNGGATPTKGSDGTFTGPYCGQGGGGGGSGTNNAAGANNPGKDGGVGGIGAGGGGGGSSCSTTTSAAGGTGGAGGPGECRVFYS